MAETPPLPAASQAQLERLAVLVGRVHLAPTLHEAIRIATEAAREIVGAHQAVISFTVDTRWAQAINAVSLSDKYAAWRDYDERPDGSGIYALVCASNRRFRMTQAELEAHPAWRGFGAAAARHPPMRGWLAVPLVSASGANLGLIQLSDKYEGEFTAADEAILAQFAHVAAQAVENVRLREQLAEQEERLRLALEAARLGTWEHRPDTGAVSWDERCRRILGVAPDAELGFREFAALIHPDDLQYATSGIQKALDPAGPGACSLEYRIRTPDGEERWVEAHGRTVFQGGKALRINGTLVDITVRKRAEEALREAARRKDEFLAMLGHELRNPLAPIGTALELLRQRHPDLAPREREVIERQLRHMMRLVDDLLDVARITRGNVQLRRERVVVAEGVARALELASPLFDERGHHLTVEVPDALVVDADLVRLSQMLCNLLTNAAKYTPPGGHVALRAERVGAEVRIEVEDDGIGIAPEQLESVFELFVQAEQSVERAQGGLGLGLPIVRSLARLHGGRIEARSAGPGRGSTFVLHLPAAEPAPERPAVDPVAAAPPRASRRVLVVDDNRDAADTLADLLRLLGHRCEVAYDGPQALAAVARLRPDVAILDIGLPVMDGYELARRIRSAPELRSVRLVRADRLRAGERPQARARGRLRRAPREAGRARGARGGDRLTVRAARDVESPATLGQLDCVHRTKRRDAECAERRRAHGMRIRR